MKGIRGKCKSDIEKADTTESFVETSDYNTEKTKKKEETVFYVHAGGRTRHVTRLKLPDGWLVSSIVESGAGLHTSTTFIPDKDHLWKL